MYMQNNMHTMFLLLKRENKKKMQMIEDSPSLRYFKGDYISSRTRKMTIKCWRIPTKKHNSQTFSFLFLLAVDWAGYHSAINCNLFFLVYIAIAIAFLPHCQFIMDIDNTLLPQSCLEFDHLGFADSPLCKF